MTGIIYTPRQDVWDGGIVLAARLEASEDGVNWVIADDDIEFDNVVNSRQQQVVKLRRPVKARFVRTTATRTQDDSDLASTAEISVLVE